MVTMIDETFSERVGRAVRLVRTSKGMSQRDLAKALGVAQPNICALEKGRVTWTFEYVVRAAAALGVAVEDLSPRVHMTSVSTAG